MALTVFNGPRVRLFPPDQINGYIAYNNPLPKRRIETVKDPKAIVAVYPESQDSMDERCFKAPTRRDRNILQPLGTPTDRFALYLSEILGALEVNVGPSGPVPQIDLELRLSQGESVATPVWKGNLKGMTWDSAALIMQFTGLLGVQWEIWGNVPPDLPDAKPVDLAMSCEIARCGGMFGVVEGPFTTTTFIISHITK